jgi:hypothetical protein
MLICDVVAPPRFVDGFSEKRQHVPAEMFQRGMAEEIDKRREFGT